MDPRIYYHRAFYNQELLDFIRTIVSEDQAAGRNGGRVATRFPPEPNGYLHIGHAKSICLNFGVARDYGGTCNLRYDTNPVKEDVEYVDSIMADVRWLGFEWDSLHFASDYFEQLYDYGVELISKEKAYVDSQSSDEIRQNRGTLTEPGTDSPFRIRTVARTWIYSGGCAPASFPTAPTCSAPGSTWRRRTSTCGIRSCTG